MTNLFPDILIDNKNIIIMPNVMLFNIIKINGIYIGKVFEKKNVFVMPIPYIERCLLLVLHQVLMNDSLVFMHEYSKKQLSVSYCGLFL